MDLDIAGRIGLVTGASAGIGQGIAQMLAAEGVQVVVTARRGHRLEQVAAEIAATGALPPHIIVGDLTDPQAVGRIADEVRQRCGHLDILVNAAGGSRPTTAEDGDETWQEAMDLNFHAARRLTHALLPLIRARHGGRIINISGAMAAKQLDAAMAGKAALHSWARGLATELAPRGITVNSIVPGRIDSEQLRERLLPTEESCRRYVAENIPIGYIGEPEDVANLVVFLASPLARYITGTMIRVDGGMFRVAL